MVNIAFVNYLGQIGNLTEVIDVPILKNKTTFEQTLPISLYVSKFDSRVTNSTKDTKRLYHQYNHKKEIFYLNERHDNMDKTLPNKNFFSKNFIVDVFLFVTAIISFWLQP